MARPIPWRSTAVLAALLLVVCLRSELFLRFPGAHFDSDQAMFGLMADDLVAGDAIPSFTYGRRYMLAVSVWMVAPLFAAWGSSVFLLKLPMLVMNLAVVVMLWVGLRRENLSRVGTSLAILPFALPSVATASRLVEHAGGNIEPFVGVLAAYFIRKRPVLLGFVFAIAFLNREFALFGFIALLVIDVLEGMDRTRLKARALSAGVMLVTVFGMRELAEHFTRFKGPSPILGSPQLANLFGFFTHQLPNLIGGHVTPLAQYNITSSLSTGHTFAFVLLTGWLLLCLVMLRPARAELSGFPAYLVLIGAAQAAAFMFFVQQPTDTMLLRYVLLCLFGLVGLIALAWRRATLQAVTVAVVLGIALANVSDYVRLEGEYARAAPRSDAALLADALERHAVRYARADYWLAYCVTFMTQRRVLVAPTYDDRSRRIALEVAAHADEAVSIAKQTCASPAQLIERVRDYVLCAPRVAVADHAQPTAAEERAHPVRAF